MCNALSNHSNSLSPRISLRVVIHSTCTSICLALIYVHVHASSAKRTCTSTALHDGSETGLYGSKLPAFDIQPKTHAVFQTQYLSKSFCSDINLSRASRDIIKSLTLQVANCTKSLHHYYRPTRTHTHIPYTLTKRLAKATLQLIPSPKHLPSSPSHWSFTHSPPTVG